MRINKLLGVWSSILTTMPTRVADVILPSSLLTFPFTSCLLFKRDTNPIFIDSGHHHHRSTLPNPTSHPQTEVAIQTRKEKRASEASKQVPIHTSIFTCGFRAGFPIQAAIAQLQLSFPGSECEDVRMMQCGLVTGGGSALRSDSDSDSRTYSDSHLKKCADRIIRIRIRVLYRPGTRA